MIRRRAWEAATAGCGPALVAPPACRAAASVWCHPAAADDAAAAWARPARRTLATASAPLQQQAKKKGGAGPAAPVVEEKYDLTKQIPVNLLKGACGGSVQRF